MICLLGNVFIKTTIFPSRESGGKTMVKLPPINAMANIYSILLWLYSLLLGLGRFFSFIIYTVGCTPWTEDEPIASPLPIQKTTHTQNKCIHTSMPRVGFEPTTRVWAGEDSSCLRPLWSERADISLTKTVCSNRHCFCSYLFVPNFVF
jgi:hypothetical protein